MTLGEPPTGSNGGELSASRSISFTHGNKPCRQGKGLRSGSECGERRSCPFRDFKKLRPSTSQWITSVTPRMCMDVTAF